jgi:hypothetical protein
MCADRTRNKTEKEMCAPHVLLVEELGDAVGVHLAVRPELLAVVIGVDYNELVPTGSEFLTNLFLHTEVAGVLGTCVR